MGTKRDARGRFVKTKPNCEDLLHEIATLTNDRNDWKAAFLVEQSKVKKLQNEVKNLETKEHWFFNHSSCWIRRLYIKVFYGRIL